jgi:hypothetical protein
MCRYKSLLLIFIALWLPLQAAAAWAMPFCRHVPQSAQAGVMHSEAHCHEQQGDVPAGKVTADPDCDNCEMCHLASAGYIPPTPVSLPLPGAGVFVAQQVLASPSFIPVPPQDPPRRLN